MIRQAKLQVICILAGNIQYLIQQLVHVSAALKNDFGSGLKLLLILVISGANHFGAAKHRGQRCSQIMRQIG
ncbi:hypothetical protein D3C84_1268720 [compost metagenome]